MIFSSLFRPITVALSADKGLYNSIYNIFGFYPDNIAPYKLALHHKSAPLANTSRSRNSIDLNNERLEFLGDAIIGAVVADFIFRSFPYKNEGFMSEMRSKIVSRAQLNKLSVHLGLNQLIQYQHDAHSKSLEGDAFEAFMGALYIDKGYNFTKHILKRVINDNFDVHELETQNYNFKSQLLELCQKNKQVLEYKVIDTTGVNQKKQYIVRAFIDGQPFETGCDFNIKGAEQAASEKTLNKINNNKASSMTL